MSTLRVIKELFTNREAMLEGFVDPADIAELRRLQRRALLWTLVYRLRWIAVLGALVMAAWLADRLTQMKVVVP